MLDLYPDLRTSASHVLLIGEKTLPAIGMSNWFLCQFLLQILEIFDAPIYESEKKTLLSLLC